jgi:DnaJ-class molecular chaperone
MEIDMATIDDDACKTCFGAGYLPIMQDAKWGRPIKPQTPCPRCSGTGRKLKPAPIGSKMDKARRTRRVC